MFFRNHNINIRNQMSKKTFDKRNSKMNPLGFFGVLVNEEQCILDDEEEGEGYQR